MITVNGSANIFIYTVPVDMRKAIDGLSLLLVEVLEQSPQSGDIYIFCNKIRTKVKLLYWDKNGFILHYKRLEKGRFKWPKKQNGNEQIEINAEQLSWLFAGLDFILMDTFSELNFENYC